MYMPRILLKSRLKYLTLQVAALVKNSKNSLTSFSDNKISVFFESLSLFVQLSFNENWQRQQIFCSSLSNQKEFRVLSINSPLTFCLSLFARKYFGTESKIKILLPQLSSNTITELLNPILTNQVKKFYQLWQLFLVSVRK